MSRRGRRLAAIGLATSLLLAACGDDSDDDAGAEAPAQVEAGAPAEGGGSGGDAADEVAASGEVTVTHAQGETTVPVNPETVVVFDLGVLDTLDALGIEVDGVPTVASLPEDLAEYGTDEYTKVGSLFEPDYEQVNALEPDLIIVAARSATVYPELAKIAPTIDLSVDNTNFIPSFRERLTTLGTIFDVEEEVEAELAEIDEAIERVNGLAADAGEALIVLTSGGKVSAFGPGSRFGLIHDVLGVKPVIEDVEAATHGEAVSFEFLLEANPDLLYVIDRDATIGQEGEAASKVLDNELVAQTTAWQDGAVTYLDGFRWYLAPSGLRSVAGMVAEIEASLT